MKDEALIFVSISPSFATAPALLLSAATDAPVIAADPMRTGAQPVNTATLKAADTNSNFLLIIKT